MLDWAGDNERTATELFDDYIAQGFSAKDAYVIATLVIAPFPYRHGELKELGEVYLARITNTEGEW